MAEADDSCPPHQSGALSLAGQNLLLDEVLGGCEALQSGLPGDPYGFRIFIEQHGYGLTRLTLNVMRPCEIENCFLFAAYRVREIECRDATRQSCAFIQSFKASRNTAEFAHHDSIGRYTRMSERLSRREPFGDPYV